ncbi:MAG TPA: NUDIX hydrolase [Candidatus Baltobacteraceae bacterium]|nr:NUDIX hydrolase [Candidatus Baltobacteraceae bacterium]
MTVVYKNKWLRIERMRVRRGGKDYFMYCVAKRDIVVVLPILDKDTVILERQYRAVFGRYLYEIPAGYIEDHEPPISAAIRELEEETGYRAGRMMFVSKLAESPGTMKLWAHFYIATGLERGRRSLDRNEDITIMKVKLSRALQMVRSGKIVDLKTMAALSYYAQFVDKGRR